MRRRLRLLLLVSLAAAAACGGDEPESDESAVSGEYIIPGQEPYVSPEDSAAAEETVRQHADSVRDAVVRASGGEPEPGTPAPPAAGGSVEERYRACMQQAQSADEPVRARLAAACANIRNQPER